MSLPIIGDIIGGVTDLIDDMHTSDKERLEIQLESDRVQAGLVQGQIDVNKQEAAHASVFVAGGRPAIIWVGAGALAWTFIGHPIMTWIWILMQALAWIPASLPPPPIIDIDALMVLVGGILGLGGYRTVEKVKGVARGKISRGGQ